jgi:1-acyl-sn-glycerol-3-phosphate acyltransferase
MGRATFRRPVTITAWLAMSILCLALSPLLIALAGIASALMRRPQPLILARLLVAYFARELAVLIACAALWLASGAGLLMRTKRFQLLHYRLLRWFVHGVATRALELLDIDVKPELSAETARALEADRPMLLFSRHAGPGDTVILVDLLLTRFDRLPSVVFKASLAIDPCVDLIGHRLPHAVLDTADPDECEARIATVAAELGPRGVLLLFPEGGNFTAERRRQAIGKLWRKGLRREAAKAQEMSHVLPPRPTGALAALRANPSADVIFGAHTGLGLAAFPRELWRKTPIGKTLTARMWLAPAADRPSDPEAQVDWIYDWWKRLDEWIEHQGQEPETEGGPAGAGDAQLSQSSRGGR